jgi:hypothetical protein
MVKASLFIGGKIPKRRSNTEPSKCSDIRIAAIKLPLKFNGAPRPMKMGTIISPWRYEVAA